MKRVPNFKTDRQAEEFLDQDLADLDFSQFKPVKFELAKKETSLYLRVPTILLDSIKERAAKKGIPYSRYVRMVLENDIRHGH